MTLDELKASLSEAAPPADLSLALQVLWHDAKEDWETAHNISQKDGSSDGSWVHAYLHRKEGDLANAGYWYSRAGRNMPGKSLEAEWDDIAAELLTR